MGGISFLCCGVSRTFSTYRFSVPRGSKNIFCNYIRWSSNIESFFYHSTRVPKISVFYRGSRYSPFCFFYCIFSMQLWFFHIQSIMGGSRKIPFYRITRSKKSVLDFFYGVPCFPPFVFLLHHDAASFFVYFVLIMREIS